MTSGLQNIFITGYSKGFVSNKKPFLLPDQAWQKLENSFAFRESVKKRQGLEFQGRLQRNLTHVSLGSTVNSQTAYTITDVFGPSYLNLRTSYGIGSEPFAEIASKANVFTPNVLTITIAAPDISTFTDNGNGTFTVTGQGIALGSYVDYVTGTIVLILGAATGGASITANFSYYPTIPSMGIIPREIGYDNIEQTVWFDTKYAYINNGTNYQELTAPGTTWDGTDSDFFWGYNYRGAEPQTRLLFVTNFVSDAGSPMRYTDGTTWKTFQPLLTANNVSNTNIGNVTTPWMTFSGMIATPVVAGTVYIKVGSIAFDDPDGTGVLTGNPPSNTGTINYSTGAIVLNFSPALTANQAVIVSYSIAGTLYLLQARMLIAYYGRLLAFNCVEGASFASTATIGNRLRFSGPFGADPTAINAWRSDIFGLGGVIDAPTNEDIIGCTFIKNTLIVNFEQTNWQLRYVGEYGLPFVWERVSADYGIESTFSPVLYENQQLAIGDKAIISTNAIGSQRIDIDIPETVFDFQIDNNGLKRVQGVRDYRNELIYWCYPDANTALNSSTTVTFPNKVLLYNYRNNTWAIFRDNITAFGIAPLPNPNITWDSQIVTWDDTDVYWDDSEAQENTPVVFCGNAQGFTFVYNRTNPDDASLSIQGINVTTTPIQITIPNHNLLQFETIQIEDMSFLNATTFAALTSNTLNGGLYRVNNVIDANTIAISQWNISSNTYDISFPFSFSPTTSVANVLYMGNGTVTLFPKLNAQSKDINLYQQKGLQIKLSYLDFLVKPSQNASMTVNLFVNSSYTVQGNILLGSTPPVYQPNMQTINSQPFYTKDPLYSWFRYFSTLSAQYFSISLTYNDTLMNQLATHTQDWELYAINAWCRPGGKITF